MDYSGNGDYDVNTPFKFEGDDQDQPSGGVEDSRTVHHSQDDLIYPPLDFAAPTPTPQHGDAPSTSTSNSHNNMMDAQPSIDLVTSNSNSANHILDNNTGEAVAMETNDAVAMETSQERPPSSPESDEIPLAARTRTRPSRSTRSKKSFVEVNEYEDEEVFETKPPKGINLYEDSTPALVGTQSIFSSDIQKERRANLTKGAKKKKKKEPEFCRFCFTNELSLTKVRSAKLPPSSSHPNTKLTTLVPAVSEIDLCLSEKWTNPSFQLVCNECVLVFSQFYEFRQAVQTNDTLLRRLYCSSKAKSKKPPVTPAASSAVPTPKGRGRPPKHRDPSSGEDSDAKSTVSTKSIKKKARGKRKGVTDDEDTDGYLSSVSKASRKSTTSRKGAGKKKRVGGTSDEETDGYMSSVSRKSTNTGSATKSKKKRRYNSDSDNEDVKSDVSDGMDYAPTAYDYDEDWNNIDEEDLITKASSHQVTKLKIKTEPDDKQWNEMLSTEVKVKEERDESDDTDNESDAQSNKFKNISSTESNNFRNVVSKYLGYNIDDLNTIDKRARDVKKRRGRKKKGDVTTTSDAEEKPRKKIKRAKTPVPVEVEVKTEQKSLVKKQKRAKKKKVVDLDKKPSDMENIFASLDEESSEDSEDDEDWEETHLGEFSPYEYTCRVCSITLNSYDKLLRHIKSEHGGYETSSLCYHCGYYSKNRSTLKNHVRVEHGENHEKRKEKKICDICSAEVVHLAIHKKHSHSGTYHVCPHCGKKFTRKAELQLHIKGIHLKHQLEKTYICEFCHKEFTFYNYLRRHMRVHTNEKPYKCKDCDVGFNHNVSLKNHRNSTCPKRAVDGTPPPPRRTQSHLSSNSTSPSHQSGHNLSVTPTQSVTPALTHSNVRIPKFDRRQTQRSMMEMIQNSAAMPTNVPFPAVFDAAHMYYYG